MMILLTVATDGVAVVTAAMMMFGPIRRYGHRPGAK